MRCLAKNVILASSLVAAFMLSGWTVSLAKELPTRGTLKDSVQTRYGTPQQTRGPVGDPPISRWIYPDFAVVFEYDHVVHAYYRNTEVEQRPMNPRPSPSQGDTLSLQ